MALTFTRAKRELWGRLYAQLTQTGAPALYGLEPGFRLEDGTLVPEWGIDTETCWLHPDGTVATSQELEVLARAVAAVVKQIEPKAGQ